jgi:hypothetical protein
LSVCNGYTTTLADTSTAGVWVATSTHATVGFTTGIVTGVSAGSAPVSYLNSDGCFVTANVTVSANATIAGATSLCGGGSVTLTATPSGGTWTSYNTSVATVASSISGSILGVGNGVDTIYYTVPGCPTAEHVDTVDYVATIVGAGTICLGQDSMLLTDATTGGAWTSSNTAITTIGSASGQLYTVSGGYDTVTYTVAFTGSTASCHVSQQIWVDGGCRFANPATGITNTVENQVYTLFPNPTNGNITITQSEAVDGVMQVTVMNDVGSKVYSGSVEFISGWGRLNLNYAAGMYLVLLQDKKGAVQTFKVIIEK